MLEITTECRKGIFFVRLKGTLDKTTTDILRKEITSLVKENEIRNILFNLNEVTKIDIKGISELYYNFELCKKNNGMSLLCGINENIFKTIKNSRITKYMNEIANELNAFDLL